MKFLEIKNSKFYLFPYFEHEHNCGSGVYKHCIIGN